MARFKKFYQRYSHNREYDVLLIGELQSDPRGKDPEVHLRIDYVAKKATQGFQSGNPIIVTSLTYLDNLVAEMKRYKAIKTFEKEAKKVAKSRTITRTKEAGTEKSL